jgi:hypothetical protein
VYRTLCLATARKIGYESNSTWRLRLLPQEGAEKNLAADFADEKSSQNQHSAKAKGDAKKHSPVSKAKATEFRGALEVSSLLRYLRVSEVFLLRVSVPLWWVLMLGCREKGAALVAAP